jgi:hypothetical protein
MDTLNVVDTIRQNIDDLCTNQLSLHKQIKQTVKTADNELLVAELLSKTKLLRAQAKEFITELT